MDDGARPVVADVADRLNSKLVEAPDLDALARTLLTGLMGPGTLPCVHAAALGLVEGAGRRLRLLSTDDDLGGAGRHPAWSHIDSFDDQPLNRVVRTGEPLVGTVDELGTTYPDFSGRLREAGAVCVAVVPLQPVIVQREVAEAAGPPDRPLGALALYYDCEQGFDAQQRQELALLGRVVSYALRRLSGGTSPHPEAPGDPRCSGATEAATLLPSDERAPARARRFLRERLEQWEVCPDVSATAELCLSELVTNAVMHARSSSHLLVAVIEGMLEVCVRDHGGPPERRAPVTPLPSEPELGTDPDLAAELAPEAGMDPRALRVHGRGLMLVESLSSAWGAEPLPDGTSVWFALDLPQTG